MEKRESITRPQAGPPSEGQSTSIRVLVVRGGELRDRVDRAIGVARTEAVTVVVPSFLAAMGDMASRPADVIIGPVDAMPGMIGSTAAALRQLSPTVRLVVTASELERQAATAAVNAGFDAALVEPFDTNEIAKAMDIGNGHRPTSRRAAASDAAAATPTTRGASPAALQVGDAQIGDVDLIDAMLVGAEPLLAQALRVVVAQSGLADVEQVPDGADAPPGYTTAPITYRGESFGRLAAAPPAAPQRVTAWADWLARWLAMDAQLANLRDLSLKDELTGAWNRRYFNRFLERILDRARHDRQQVTLLVFDIDDFKSYNDRYGHAAGDEILRETARLMQTVCREHDVIARIGGDEFAVIFWDADEPRRQGSMHPNDVKRAARRFQEAICAHKFPKLAEDAPGTLTISGGLAGFPWDGQTPDELIDMADAMAMKSKRQGKNAITFGPGALRGGETEPA